MGGRSARLIAGIVVATLAGLGSGIAGVHVLVIAAGLHHTANPNPDRPAIECVLAEAILAVTALCAWLAIHLARRLRPPAAATADSRYGPYPVPEVPRGRYRKLETIAMPIGAVAAAAGFVFMSSSAVVNLSYADRSAYVQAHGIHRSAAVDSVQNIAHNTRSGIVYTSTLSVTVKSPAARQGNAVVYDPDGTTIKPGSTIAVLLDPGQPAYAELPGHPYSNYVRSVVFAVIAVVLSVLAVYFSLAAVARRRRQPIWAVIPGRLARAYLMKRKSGLDPADLPHI